MEDNIIDKKIITIVGSEVLPYKSSFAKSIVVNYRDLKTINNNDINIENNNINLNDTTGNINNIISSKMTLPMDENKNHEIDQLRKQCQDLNEENQRLQSLLQTNQTPRVQAIDNVLLQTQIDTLTWQIKQNESSQQMYRSLMRQMLNFLERAKKSLDIIHERTNPIGKNKSTRNSIYIDESELINSSTITNTKFTRAKSITQISSSLSTTTTTTTTSSSSSSSAQNSYSGLRDFTWSVLKKNDTTLNCSTPKIKNNNNNNKIIKKNDLNKIDDIIVNKRINNDINEDNDDYVPPNKLSQEAFRLMRTIESLLTTISSSPFSSTLSSASSTSSLSINDKDTMINNQKDISSIKNYQINDNENNNKKINSINTNDGSFIDDDYSFKHVNDTFIISDENNKKYNNNNNKNISKKLFNGNCSSSIRLQINKTATINDNDLSILRDDKASSSIVNNNSADDESGFSSMNSFQDVGIPVTTTTTTTSSSSSPSTTTTTAGTTTILPISNSPGLHTEIGLPDVPIDKNIKWPSNTIDLQLKIKNYKNEYINNNNNNSNSTNRAKIEQRSVWV